MPSSAPELTNAKIKALKAQAHHLSPVVMIGSAGLTDAVLNELSVALNAHELIKVRVTGDSREERKAIMERICNQLACAPIQSIGKQLIVYRQRPDHPEKNEPHVPKKLAAQGITKAPTSRKSTPGTAKAKPGSTRPSGGKAKAKPKRLSRNAQAAGTGKGGDNKRGRKQARAPR